MANVTIIADQRDGKLKKTTFELIFASAQAKNETHVVVLGAGLDTGALSQELGSYGANQVHVLSNDALKTYTAEAYVAALSGFFKNQKADIILASHTPTGRDFMPKLAASLDTGLASDCVSLVFEGTGIKVRRPVYSGKATAEVEFFGSGPKLATIRPNALTPPQKGSGSAQANSVSADLGGLKTKLIEIVKGSSARPDVTEASAVISGGRSLKSADNFKLLEELADTIGAAVGASRAAVDAGFRPHRDQVGQTGKTVSPQLYIACGISGAIQHLAGMRTSKVIVAINTDSEAPIFQLADYGIVGDLFTVVPLLTQEFKKLKEA